MNRAAATWALASIPHCVYPVEWRESGDECWWMLLRCGECGAEREVTVANHVAQRFEDDLDQAEREIKRAVATADDDAAGPRA
jgi:hypothetical protein